MFLKFSSGFLLASLFQALIVYLGELMGISTLDAKFTFGQLLTHIVVGQAAGYILLVLIARVEALSHTKTVIIGAVYGTLLWWLLLTINSALGNVNAPWNEGISTILVSLSAFMAYGMISAFAIRRYGRKYSHI